MRQRNKKIFAGSMAAVLLLGASSLAWFTDRTEGSVSGQAGSLCLELTDIEGDLDSLAPGDNRKLAFGYKNIGSLAMDTRVTYALSYELNSDVEDALADDELYKLDKIATLTVGEDQLVLTADSDTETETFETGTLKGLKEDVGDEKLMQSLNFHFDESVGNLGQLMKFKLEILVEGKQNRNNPTWEQVHKTTIKFGDQDLDVVPKSSCNVNNEEGYNINFKGIDNSMDLTVPAENPDPNSGGYFGSDIYVMGAVDAKPIDLSRDLKDVRLSYIIDPGAPVRSANARDASKVSMKPGYDFTPSPYRNNVVSIDAITEMLVSLADQEYDGGRLFEVEVQDAENGQFNFNVKPGDFNGKDKILSILVGEGILEEGEDLTHAKFIEIIGSSPFGTIKEIILEFEFDYDAVADSLDYKYTDVTAKVHPEGYNKPGRLVYAEETKFLLTDYLVGSGITFVDVEEVDGVEVIKPVSNNSTDKNITSYAAYVLQKTDGYENIKNWEKVESIAIHPDENIYNEIVQSFESNSDEFSIYVTTGIRLPFEN